MISGPTPEQIEADFAYPFDCDSELRMNQVDEGMGALIDAIEALGASEELTAVVVMASYQLDRIRRMKIAYRDLWEKRNDAMALLTGEEGVRIVRLNKPPGPPDSPEPPNPPDVS